MLLLLMQPERGRTACIDPCVHHSDNYETPLSGVATSLYLATNEGVNERPPARELQQRYAQAPTQLNGEVSPLEDKQLIPPTTVELIQNACSRWC